MTNDILYDPNRIENSITRLTEIEVNETEEAFERFSINLTNSHWLEVRKTANNEIYIAVKLEGIDFEEIQSMRQMNQEMQRSAYGEQAFYEVTKPSLLEEVISENEYNSFITELQRVLQKLGVVISKSDIKFKCFVLYDKYDNNTVSAEFMFNIP